MPLIEFKIKHGRTLDQARAQLDQVVGEVQRRFGPLVRSVEWTPGREAVVLAGPGVDVRMLVDLTDVHVAGDIPLVASLLGPTGRLKQLVAAAFSPPSR